MSSAAFATIWPRPSLAEGRGLSFITVCGYRRETRASLSLARDLVVGQKLFLSSGWEGLCPVGFARPYSSREKRSSRRRLRALRVRPMGESSLRTASGSAVHFGTRAALCERQSPQLPTKAVAARGGPLPWSLKIVCFCASAFPKRLLRKTGATRARRPAVALVVRGARRCRGRDIESAAEDKSITASSSRGGWRPLRARRISPRLRSSPRRPEAAPPVRE